MFCNQCGSQLMEGASFCQKCGTKIHNEETVQNQETVVEVNDETMTDQLDAVLTDVGVNKVKVIKLMREWSVLGLKEAKELVEQTPVLIKNSITPENAVLIKEAFEAVGAEVSFINREGKRINFIRRNPKGTEELDNADNLGRTTHHEGNSDISGPESFDESAWKKELFEECKKVGKKWLNIFMEMPIVWKVLIALGVFAAFLIFIALIKIIFSSFILLVTIMLGGYIVYQRWIAIYITEFIYDRKSTELQLPVGMSSQTLLEALSGKFNYPYFKGVRYGEKGECVIEGQYWTYPVDFYEDNTAYLTCTRGYDEKKYRTILLEAMAICSYINKFFNPMVPVNVEKDLKLLKSAERQRKMTAVVCSAASFLLILALIFKNIFPGGLEMIAKPGAEVRNAYLSQYNQNVTIEDAFESFFDNGKWSTYKDKEYSYVVFTGTCEYMGEKADVKVKFKITGENFIIDSLDINGREQNELILYGLLTAVYEDF